MGVYEFQKEPFCADDGVFQASFEDICVCLRELLRDIINPMRRQHPRVYVCPPVYQKHRLLQWDLHRIQRQGRVSMCCVGTSFDNQLPTLQIHRGWRRIIELYPFGECTRGVLCFKHQFADPNFIGQSRIENSRRLSIRGEEGMLAIFNQVRWRIRDPWWRCGPLSMPWRDTRGGGCLCADRCRSHSAVLPARSDAAYMPGASPLQC